MMGRFLDMRHLECPRPTWPFGLQATALLLFVLTGFPLLWRFLQRFDAAVFREHGPMENFQVLCLLAGIGLLARIAFLNLAGAARVLVFGLVVLHLNLFLVEFDTREWDVAALDFFFRGTSRNVMLVLAWTTAAALFAGNSREVWLIFTRWLPTRSGTLMWVAGIFWILGGAIDKTKLFPSSGTNLFMEEAMEANGALLMLLSVISLLAAWSQNKGHGGPDERFWIRRHPEGR